MTRTFIAGATRVLDLYQCRWEHQPLGADEYVLYRARQLRVEDDDRRGGALPTSPPTRHCGTVTGRCAAHRRRPV